MAIRTLNYTDRKRLRREDVRVVLRKETNGHSFDAAFDFEGYALPSGADVFVEAYRQSLTMRFGFGKVGLIRPPESRLLHQFDSPEGVLFRVKVTSRQPSGLLHAEADQIRPRKSQDDDSRQLSLLPVVPDHDLGDEVWRVEFDETQVLLKVNANFGDYASLARHDAFVALVYPMAFRHILGRILGTDDHTDTTDLDDWRSRWLYFASRLPGMTEPPKDSESQEQWIESASASFARHQGLYSRFARFWNEEQKS